MTAITVKISMRFDKQATSHISEEEKVRKLSTATYKKLAQNKAVLLKVIHTTK